MTIRNELRLQVPVETEVPNFFGTLAHVHRVLTELIATHGPAADLIVDNSVWVLTHRPETDAEYRARMRRNAIIRDTDTMLKLQMEDRAQRQRMSVKEAQEALRHAKA